MTIEHKVDEILTIVKEERQLNNTRFTQLVARIDGVEKELKSTKQELKEEIKKVYTSLAEDIQALATDHDRLKRRMDKFERKVALQL